MVFSGRAATGGGATSRSASSADVAAAGEDVLYAFYKEHTTKVWAKNNVSPKNPKNI